MLYSIQKPQSSRISYLFGTMHVADKRAFAFIEQALSCLNKCHIYVGEVDLSKLDRELMLKAFHLPEGLTISQLLGEKKYVKCQKILQKSFKYNLDEFNHLAPIFIINNLAIGTLNQDYPEPLDAFLFKHAVEHNKLLDGLETPHEQFEVAQKLDLNQQRLNLLKLCKNPSKERKKIKSLINLYAKGDDIEIYRRSKNALGSFRKIMIKERNLNMFKKLASLVEMQSCFISCGAAHLQGGYGIVSQLKKSGFIVKKLI